MTTESIETVTQQVPGIYELARENLTVLAEEFRSERWVRLVSAWRRAVRMDPEDLADSYEGPYGLRLRVINDIGCTQAEAGCDEIDCYKSFAALRLAYGTDWPSEALRDYCRVFDGCDDAKAEAVSRSWWAAARTRYDNFKFADGEPPTKAT
ncbi:hypothetical protein [Pseudomonas aeruginosa]|uniref:hypothetical protein n=1 Tax=Pseudomonas aeruginosa TaxID=287 RepID=UPI0021E22B54|nr:hypothetical protein [Pseudomonas aeruginosa]MCV0098077.1 hypothetical protein [Pseudomonas aeruginosa]